MTILPSDIKLLQRLIFSRNWRMLSLCLPLIALLLFSISTAHAAPVTVRFSEGMVRGFLTLSDTSGARLASGDFLQTRNGDEVKCRTVLNFKDGSVHDESAVFTQQRVFMMQSYNLVQKGPSFKDDMEISLERATGRYQVKVKARKTGQEKVYKGKLDLPPDVYNGMVPTVVKNIPRGGKESVHIVGFTPAPRVLRLDINPSGEDRLMVGDLNKSAVHYILKPKLGMLTVPATLLGRTPPDNHLWVITADVPAFVKFEGPLYTDGPIWRVELTSPVWPK